MKRALTHLGTTVAAAGLLSGLFGGLLYGLRPAGTAEAASPPLEAQMLALVQQARVANGLAPLIVSAGLTRAAETWSDHQLGVGTISHNPDPGSFLAPFWLRWGENVGVGPSPAVLMAMFMASPEHRANILGDFNRIGVGDSLRGDGSQFVTLDFELFPPGV
jgi:uncharacterized protein YkwD